MRRFGQVHVDLAKMRDGFRDLMRLIEELESRQVMTELRPDYELRVMVEVRMDNQEVIATRPLTLAERNATLSTEQE